ncbi:hypothetical protein GCM10007205_26930 [Oxalicibacterium flavum]|uniref:Uncharacterized protein n=1 Tax=Oxalicibacterium flavum TaxID=179467 RepID=A0A8J2UNA3_9BURK|nr:hypothetical protein [Oxalicibacterium flavum]GGC16543.1 hypothetical protein GCM10007205_26930 [Oxalicibacterium flavum]
MLLPNLYSDISWMDHLTFDVAILMAVLASLVFLYVYLECSDDDK